MMLSCPYCAIDPTKKSEDRKVIRFGSFARTSDEQILRRFRCMTCKRTFSEATHDECFRQHKRGLNNMIFRILTNTISQRASALVLGISRTTLTRKFLFLARISPPQTRGLQEFYEPASDVHLDDLETFEHTKCKPISITLAVEHRTRRILDFEIVPMKPKGKRQADRARTKYGHRTDQRAKGRRRLLQRLRKLVRPTVVIRTDQHPGYPSDIRRHFPSAVHRTFKSKRASAHGQSELKQRGYDPLFSINHTFAMFRANINRLIRSTWCTTKKLERLHAHVTLYMLAHNRALHLRAIKKAARANGVRA